MCVHSVCMSAWHIKRSMKPSLLLSNCLLFYNALDHFLSFKFAGLWLKWPTTTIQRFAIQCTLSLTSHTEWKTKYAKNNRLCSVAYAINRQLQDECERIIMVSFWVCMVYDYCSAPFLFHPCAISWCIFCVVLEHIRMILTAINLINSYQLWSINNSTKLCHVRAFFCIHIIWHIGI